LTNVGVNKDFYILKELTLQDLKVIYKLGIEPAIPHLQKVNRGWVEFFELVFKLRNVAENLGIDDAYIDELLDTAMYNFEEDFHAEIERDSIKYIDSLLNEDISFYKTEKGCIDFSHFIGIQNMRTKGAKSSVVEALSGFDFIDMDKVWNVLSHIFASNISWHLFANRQSYRLILLKNETSEDFITCDQPVINTFGVGLVDEPPEELEFYYPISPNLAVLITEEKPNSHSKISITQVDVIEYNRMIANASYTQIFAKSEEMVKKYSKVNDGKMRAT